MERKRMVMLTTTGLLTGVSVLLMLLEFPVPPFPPWLKLGFSDVPGVIGGIVFGPGVAVIINLLKNIFNVLTKGLTYGGVGELANFLMATSFALPVAILYKKGSTRNHTIVGLLVGLLFGVIVAILTNVFMLIPAAGIGSGTLAGVMKPLVELVGAADLSPIMAYALVGIAPFNVLKMGIQLVVILCIYQHLILLVRRMMERGQEI